MQSFDSRPQLAAGRGLQVGPGLRRPPSGRTGRLGAVLTTVDPFTRGPVAVAIGFGVFFPAGALGGRIGVAIAGGYLVFFSAYCLLNFWVCREAHCALTGPGFGAIGLLGLVGALWPGRSLSWYGVNVEGLAFLAVLTVGFAFERAVAARTGRRPSC
jgi:hypothetical protein